MCDIFRQMIRNGKQQTLLDSAQTNCNKMPLELIVKLLQSKMKLSTFLREKMKILFLGVMVTIAVVRGEQTAGEAPNIQPCQVRASPGQFDEFVRKHVLLEDFDKKDKVEWGR